MLFSRREKENKQVLVVDDVPTIRLIAGQVFRKAGHEVMEARNGDEALQLAREHPPDLIILDVVMAGKSGVEVLREMRADSNLKDTPVVMLTGSDDPETMQDLLPLNVKDYILKDNLGDVTEKLQAHLKDL